MTDYADVIEALTGENPTVTELRRLLSEAADEVARAREKIAELEEKVANCPGCERLIRAIGRAAGDQEMYYGTCPPPWRNDGTCPRTAMEPMPDDGSLEAVRVCTQCWRDYKDKKRKRKFKEV